MTNNHAYLKRNTNDTASRNLSTPVVTASRYVRPPTTSLCALSYLSFSVCCGISGKFWLPNVYVGYTGCPRKNVRDFGRVFLMLNYTYITQNTYVQSRMVTEIMAREKCGSHMCRNTLGRPWRHTCLMPLPDQRDMVVQWPWRVRYRTVALTSQFNRSAAACVKYLEV